MQNEIEIRVLEVDKSEMIDKLEKLGAEKVRGVKMKRINYDAPAKGGFLRLRDEGTKVTLTYKERRYRDNIEHTQELEIEVSDFDKTKELLAKMGIESKGDYQEQKRIEYRLGDISFCIDTWPHIPTYMEIEAPTREEVDGMLAKLNIDKSNCSHLAGYALFEYYGHNIENCHYLVFNEE